MWGSPSQLSITTSLLVFLAMASSRTPKLSALPHVFRLTDQGLSLQATRHKTQSIAPPPCSPLLLWRHQRPLHAQASRSPPFLLVASKRWIPTRRTLVQMGLIGTTMERGPCLETTCICPWTMHIGIPHSARVLVAVSRQGAGFLMPLRVNHSHTSMTMLTQS